MLKNAKENNISKGSSKRSRNSASGISKTSKASEESRSFRELKLSKEKELEDKDRIASKAEKLKITKNLPKLSAKVFAYD